MCTVDKLKPPPALNPTPISDHELVLRAQKGSEVAYRELLVRYQRPVFSLVFRILHDRDAAEDVVQETFVRAFTYLGKYDPKYKFSSWVFKIARDLAIAVRKRQSSTEPPDKLHDAELSKVVRPLKLAAEPGSDNLEELFAMEELGVRASEKIRISAEVPDWVDEDEAASAIAGFIEALSQLHQALGGGGLVVDGMEVESDIFVHA